jgi:sortase A
MMVRYARRLSSLKRGDDSSGSLSSIRTSKWSPHSRFLRWSRNAFLVAGVLALCYCGFVLIDAKIYQASQARRFEKQLDRVPPAMTSVAGLGDLPAPALPAGALGKIEIARIGLAAMILEGIDGRTLRRAVGHIPGTPLPGQQGNVAIAGHRDTFFRALRHVQHDDEITLTTLDGTYRYLVDSTQVVAPNDTEVLDASGDTILTLVTCYPFYLVGPAPKRFIVRAHKMPRLN